MDDSNPVTMMITFRLRPGLRQRWLEWGQELQKSAKTAPGCRRFRLVCNQDDEAECVALSEWDEASDLDTFAREVELVWSERCLDQVCDRPRYTFLVAVPDEISRVVEQRIPELATVEP